jgi:hypothetical protein
MTAVWDIAPCSLVEVDRRFSNDDGGSTYLWNVSLFQLDYKTLFSKVLSPSYSPPWEPEISQNFMSVNNNRLKPNIGFTNTLSNFLILNVAFYLNLGHKISAQGGTKLQAHRFFR